MAAAGCRLSAIGCLPSACDCAAARNADYKTHRREAALYILRRQPPPPPSEPFEPSRPKGVSIGDTTTLSLKGCQT